MPTAIQNLATDAITEVTNKLESDRKSRACVARNVNKSQAEITDVDSDGDFVGLGAPKVSGNTVFTTSPVNSTGPSDSDDFRSINQLKAWLLTCRPQLQMQRMRDRHSTRKERF